MESRFELCTNSSQVLVMFKGLEKLLIVGFRGVSEKNDHDPQVENALKKLDIPVFNSVSNNKHFYQLYSFTYFKIH